MGEFDVLDYIANDEYLKAFLTHKTSTELTKCLSITEQVKKLGEGIDLLTKELQKQVLEKHDDLLQQAHHANKLENVLATMRTHVENLVANAERLKLQIIVPYQALESHTKVLGRLHLASHILRQVNRIQQLSKHLGNTNDPIQKANVLQELEQLALDPDLIDIDAVTVEIRNIRAQQQKIVQLAKGLLLQGLGNENPSQTATALQIYNNLGNFKTHLQTFTGISLDECRESLKSTFDTSIGVTSSMKHKSVPGRMNLTSSLGFRTRIWSDLEKVFSEEIYRQCKQIKFLQVSLNNLNTCDFVIAVEFWTSLHGIIQEEINNSSSAVQQMLEEDFPRLLKCYYDMVQKLNFDKFYFNKNIFEKCENAYLSNSSTRLLEPTQVMFNQENNTPTHDEIDALCQIMTNELSVALTEENLSEKVSKNISKSIKMYVVKTEQQISVGPEASQVIGGALNSGQQMNIQLANAMYYFKTQVQRILSNMKETLSAFSATLVNDSLESIDNLTSSILQPLVASINSTIETIIITIHLETDWSKLQLPQNRHSISCSPYMRELTQFITRVYQIYLLPFDNKEILSKKCSDIAIRCIELLVRHSSLVRPISQGGRLRLQSDYGYLEHSLKVLCPYLTDLGRPYRLFKSMATLVTLSPTEIIESQASGSSVPHSTILLLLFSYAGPELASPHQNTGWSLQNLSTWFDEHVNESDRLDLIAGALQKYVTVIRQKNSINFDPVYPLMSSFLEKAVQLR